MYRISHKGTEKWIDLNGATEESSRKTGSFDSKSKKCYKSIFRRMALLLSRKSEEKSQIQPMTVSRSTIQPTHLFNTK